MTGAPLDSRADALAIMHDPRNAAYIAEAQAERLTDDVLELVSAHRAWVLESIGPRGWELVGAQRDGERWRHRGTRLLAMWSLALEADGRPWLHLSCSSPQRPPMHDELATVKEIFVGDRYAYAVWPPSDRYVNLQPNVLHLWAPWWPIGVDAWACHSCGPHPESSGTWCASGCGSDYIAMTFVPGLEPPLPEFSRVLPSGDRTI